MFQPLLQPLLVPHPQHATLAPLYLHRLISLVKVTIKSRNVTVRGPRGELKKSFAHLQSDIRLVDGGKAIRVEIWFGGKKDLACLRTVTTHLQNMFTGVLKVFTSLALSLCVCVCVCVLYVYVLLSVSKQPTPKCSGCKVRDLCIGLLRVTSSLYHSAWYKAHINVCTTMSAY
jgi:hypothetical protein